MTLRPYPLVIEEHDGSWSWSIEIGEPFEDDHRILAFDQGYPTRRDAQEAMRDALPDVHAKLRKEAEAELEARQRRLEEDQQSAPSEQSATEVAAQVRASPSHLSWGVYQAGELIAVFRDQQQGQEFADQTSDSELRRVELR